MAGVASFEGPATPLKDYIVPLLLRLRVHLYKRVREIEDSIPTLNRACMRLIITQKAVLIVSLVL